MREPTKEDIDALVGPATPHFAFQLRARVRCTNSGSSFYASGDLLKIDYDKP